MANGTRDNAVSVPSSDEVAPSSLAYTGVNPKTVENDA